MHSELIAALEKATGREKRILSRLDRSGDCWLWAGALDSRGRGRVWHNDKLMLHHRAVWEILCGPIPEDALLCHHCDNPQCANPAHLYVGDSKTNAADMIKRGRHWTRAAPEKARAVGRAIGSQNDWAAREQNPKAKLAEDQVAAIRASTVGSRALAQQYGVHRTTIQRIRSGAAWN
jgi:hypothetical protein